MSAWSGLRSASLAASAGLFAGPLAWGLNTQLNYALAGGACSREFPVVTLVAALAFSVALAGGLLSAREWRRAGAAAPNGSQGGRPDRFLAGLGVLAAAIFATVILLQGAAGIVFSGCER